MSVNRRQFIKAGSLALGSLAVHTLPLQARPAEDKATVYFTPEITTESLLRIYEKVCAPLQGRIAIKLHTGEPHGPNILSRDMVRALQARIPKSSIVECNVLYPSPRQDQRLDLLPGGHHGCRRRSLPAHPRRTAP